MKEILDALDTISSSIPILLLSILLILDQIRSILATFIIVDPDKFLGKILYGQRDKAIVSSALRDLGYSSSKSNDIVLKLKDVARSANIVNSAVSSSDAAIQLIIMLSKYIIKSESPIIPGRTDMTRSMYYINTMDIVHNEEDSKKLVAIMIRLMEYNKLQKTPEVIIASKGGNPLFAQAIAQTFNSKFLIVKSDKDKSRVKIAGNKLTECIINFEGAQELLRTSDNSRCKSCVVIDDNICSGKQLISIINSIRTMRDEEDTFLNLEVPSNVYVLFRAIVDKENVDKKYEESGCRLHRFFDLDEEAKEKMYSLQQTISREREGESLSYFNESHRQAAIQILQYLSEQKLYYYIEPISE